VVESSSIAFVVEPQPFALRSCANARFARVNDGERTIVDALRISRRAWF
jgi:hypothetical protein